MASGNRMFRVAVSYTVAVEAETDSQALSNAAFVQAYDSSVRKLSMTVLESWQVPGVPAGELIKVEAPAVTHRIIEAPEVAHFYPDNDTGLPPAASVDNSEVAGKPVDDIPF